jgi:lipopolysaccharide export LptBFGC system permease protein LptF
MGKKIIVSAIILAGISIIIYFTFLNSTFLTGNISKLGMLNMKFTEASIFNQDALKDAIPPELSIKDIKAEITGDNTGNFSIIFNVFNPNNGTVIFESISYNVYSNSTRIVSGDIGNRPEGFVDSQDSIFPVIGNGTLILKDKKIIETSNNLNLSQISRNNELSDFLVNGSYFFKQTGSFQSTGGEQTFSINYTH